MVKPLEKKPGKQDLVEPDSTFKSEDQPAPMTFKPYGDIDTEQEGVEVGLVTTVRFHFEKVGDRILGYLKKRKRIEFAEGFWVYEVYNIDGDWSISGSDYLDGRLEDVKDGSILDITFIGEKMSAKRRMNYKLYRIKFYPVPPGFDPYKYRCGLDETGKKIIFLDMPSDLGETPKIF